MSDRTTLKTCRAAREQSETAVAKKGSMLMLGDEARNGAGGNHLVSIVSVKRGS